MVEAGGEGDDIAAGLFGRDPDRLLAVPAAGHDVLREARQQVGGQRRLLQREGMIGVGNDDQRAVGNFDAHRLLQRARREEIELAVQDHGGDADRGQLRRQRLEVEKRLHQVLQRVDVVEEPAAPLGGLHRVQVRTDPGIGEIHRKQQVHEIAGAAEHQPGHHRLAQEIELRRDFGKGRDRHQPGDGVAMSDGVAQRDHAAETDAADEYRPAADLRDEIAHHLHLVVLIDEQGRLFRNALAQEIEDRHAEPARHQGVAIGVPDLDILGEAIDQNIGWPTFRAGELVADAR